MNFNKVRTIPHLHRDSISYIHVFHLKKSKGWRVWTGSLDRTIDVTHVPAEYENILKDLEDSIEEEIEIPIRESKKERKDELPKIQVPKQVSIPEEKEPLENIEIPSKSGRKTKEKRDKMVKQGKHRSAVDLKKQQQLKEREKEREKVKKKRGSARVTKEVKLNTTQNDRLSTMNLS